MSLEMSESEKKSVVLVDDDSQEPSTSEGSGSMLTTTNEASTSNSNSPIIGSRGRGRGRGGRGRGRGRARCWGRKKKGGKNNEQLELNFEEGTSPLTKFKYSCMVKEDHKLPIYGVMFNQKLDKDQPHIFATAGPRLCIYEATPDGKLKVLLCFADPDPNEFFYTCAWTVDADGKSLLAAGGEKGIVRIFSPESASCVKSLVGHGAAINDLIFHTTDQNLLLSASKDHSVRLWNIMTNVCVAIFGGAEGHRDEVISVDIDIPGLRILTSGMDHAVKTWNLNKPQIEESIKTSYSYDFNQSNRPFPAFRQNFPDYSTRSIHRNYADCAKWFGNFILSKACENELVCWKAGEIFQPWEEINYRISEFTIIHKLGIPDCDIWFIKFSMDYSKSILAVGNVKGKISIFDLTTNEPSDVKATVLSHPKCISAIRQTSLSRDGEILIYVCEDGSIWRWDRIKDLQTETGD